MDALEERPLIGQARHVRQVFDGVEWVDVAVFDLTALLADAEARGKESATSK